MLMLLKKQNLTNPDVSVQYHVALSDKVKMCCASHPGQREGCLRVIFTVFGKLQYVFSLCADNWKQSCKQCILHAEVTFSLLLRTWSYTFKD